MAALQNFSVVIPAHNEASVIERCLRAILDDLDEQPEIIVACNGCTDDTAEIARRVAPNAKILELTEGSKILAINSANAIAAVTPRFFIDADIIVSGKALKAVAYRLANDSKIKAAAPALTVDLTGCTKPVTSYYKVWLQQPYVQVGLKCLVPAFDGALSMQEWKDALWGRFYTAAPARQRQSVERYSIVKRA